MIFTGNIAAVVAAMQEKKQLLERGETDSGPRILLVGGGGVMYGAEAGGAVTAMYELGYGEVFDWVLGLSTSAPAAAYFLSGNPREGATIYSEECCTREFISATRLKNPVDTSFLDEVFKGLTNKRINTHAVLSHRTKLLIGVTNVKTGKQTITEPRSAGHLFRLVHATISMPGVTGLPIDINGHSYTDGASSNPLPIKRLVKQLEPTHVLVIPNRTQEMSTKRPLSELMTYEFLLRQRVSPVLRSMLSKRRVKYKESLRWLQEESGIPTMIAWSAGTISKFERNAEKIRQAATAAEENWRELLLQE